MQEMSLKAFDRLKIGHAQNYLAGTGCSVLLFEEGAPVGLDVRGGGPAARESELLKPCAAAQNIHAILLSGGSAFGLGAANGVMRYLEERKIGFDVGVTHVPLVCQSCLFDLTVGDPFVRPDADMAYAACLNAERGNGSVDGNVGAGTGATVGKLCGMKQCMKSGLGTYAAQVGDLKVGALVVVNALGDVFDPMTNQKVAGLLNERGDGFLNSTDVMLQNYARVDNRFVENTTLGVLLTNACFDKVALTKVASVTHNAYAQCIRPVHTSADGDSIYAVSLGDLVADMDVVCELACAVMRQAILNAVRSARSAYGYPAASEVNF